MYDRCMYQLIIFDKEVKRKKKKKNKKKKGV